jgi:hypothetical protein
MTIRFDAYTATTKVAKPTQLQAMLREPGCHIKSSKGFHTFAERMSFKDDTGTEYGSVSWGGLQGERVMIEVKGERSPGVVERLRSDFWHRVTRVDACADFDEPGAFERLLGPCEAVVQDKRIFAERRGDWDQFPELGRTYMMGSAHSTSRVRLYEKGKQQEYTHLNRPNWARLEVQVRPAKAAKESYNRVKPLDVWGASTWTRELASRLLSDHVDAHPAGTTYRRTERDRALAWMCKQYGAHLYSLQQDLGGWDVLGMTLREIINENKKETH